jgi:asparagine synthase (glutamine-hydrolysing)
VDRELLVEMADAYKNPLALQRLELSKTQLPRLLRYEDRNSMAHAIESRLPFLDYRLVEFNLQLPLRLKTKDGWSKYVLRKKAETILPPTIAWRTNKFGFEAPTSQWLAGKEELLTTIRQSSLIGQLAKRTPDMPADYTLLWRLYNLALWEEAFDVGL